MLQVKNLSVSYKEVRVIHNISFSIEEGKIFGLIGANGAGKTTTLRTISGLIKPDEGSIKFLGEEISNIPAHDIVRRGLVQVPEEGRIFPYMTVLDNLLVGAYSKENYANHKDNLKMIFDLLPRLNERKKQLAGTLSGGERQMLAVAQTLMCNPKILMLDEPSLGLAPKVITEIYSMLKEIKKQGMTIFLVEQNVRVCLKMADYAYVLENGKIVLEDTGADLIENQDVKKAYMGIG
jgi:branched-chain amino acid transport system ATP-binding protein